MNKESEINSTNQMMQPRLNVIAVCHVNQEILDSLDIRKLTEEFASRSHIRRAIFENWI